MKHKIKIIFLLIIILFSCQIAQAKNNKKVNIELLRKVYNIARSNFVGDIDREKIFNGGFERAEKFLDEQGIKAEIEKIKPTDSEEADLDLFFSRIDALASKYATEKLPREDIMREALDGMLDALADPYTFYMDPEEYKEFSDTLNMEEYSGVGIYIELDKKNDNKLTVIEAFDGSPADRVGIQAGDVIVKIDQKDTAGITLDESVKQIGGEKGTTVILTIDRKGELHEFSIVRDMIKLENVVFKVIDNKIGYIKIRSFAENTGEDLQKAMEALVNKKVVAFILDLRNNGGGYVESAIDVTSKFLPTESTIVTVKEKKGSPLKYKSRGTFHSDLPLLVLVNQYSASASEITAGALQDNKRGMLVGVKTFGKGCVQTIYPIDISGVLKITTAHYYTPSDRDIDKNGLDPDMEVEMDDYLLGKDGDDVQLKEAVNFFNKK